jgi:hypothetical protein
MCTAHTLYTRMHWMDSLQMRSCDARCFLKGRANVMCPPFCNLDRDLTAPLSSLCMGL